MQVSLGGGNGGVAGKRGIFSLLQTLSGILPGKIIIEITALLKIRGSSSNIFVNSFTF